MCDELQREAIFIILMMLLGSPLWISLVPDFFKAWRLRKDWLGGDRAREDLWGIAVYLTVIFVCYAFGVVRVLTILDEMG
jgi:hypothetical protein